MAGELSGYSKAAYFVAKGFTFIFLLSSLGDKCCMFLEVVKVILKLPLLRLVVIWLFEFHADVLGVGEGNSSKNEEFGKKPTVFVYI